MLNKEQKLAVEITDKPLIITAGPGTGKTHLITEKIDYLIEEKKINPDEILAVTFTKKAALEMSERVEKKTKKIFLAKTFHEFANMLIEDYQKYIPEIDKNFTLIEENAQKIFFLENLDEFNLKSVELKNNSVLIANEIQSTISKLKDFGVCLKKFQTIETDDMMQKIDILTSYSKYEVWKKKNNFIDFGDLLLYLKNLLENNNKIKIEIQNKYKYILVDEFQDTNTVQLDILKLISKKNNITIVGDKKQSIYAFRGSNFSNLDEFKKHFSNSQEIILKENYRNSKNVLDIVNKVTKNMKLPEEILNNNNSEKGETKLIKCKNETAQKSYLADKISLIQDLYPNSKIGILFRRKLELIETSKFFSELGIKHSSVGSNNFLNSDISEEILQILQILTKPSDENIVWFKVLENFGLSNEVIKKVFRISKLKEKSIFNVLKKYMSEFEENQEKGCDKESYEILNQVFEIINDLVNMKNSKISLYELIRQVCFKLNIYQKSLININKENIENINSIINYTEEFVKIYKTQDLEKFILFCENSKKMEISTSNEEQESQIELLTIHNSKGKEFDFVFVPYLNERRFPTSFKRSKFDILNLDDKEKFLEEETRLFFVAISRAKKSLYLSYVLKFSGNLNDSKPSTLLEELNLDEEEFTREIDTIKLTTKEEIKVEIIQKINDLLLQNNYELAKNEMDLLKELFEKKKNNLNSFIKNEDENKHPDFDFYKDKLLGKSQKNKNQNIEFDSDKQTYSVSQLKTYEQCPKKYLYSYIYRIPTESKHFFDFGTSLHAVFENLVLEFKKYSDEVLYVKGISMLKDKWISKGYTNSTQEKEYFEKGVIAIKNFIKTQRELQKDETRKTIGEEEKFLIEMNGKKIIGFIDRIDIVNGEYQILDYKTSNSMMTKPQLKNDLQLYVYSEALKIMKGKYPESVGLWYVIFDEIKTLEKSEIKYTEQKQKIIDLFEKIDKKDFRANPTHFNCTYCDYNKICNKK